MGAYRCRGKVVLWPGEQGAWHFVNVDKRQSEAIRARFKEVRRGFGSIPVAAVIGKTKWKTSIFPDKRSGTYLLPLKASIRLAEGIAADDTISFTLDM